MNEKKMSIYHEIHRLDRLGFNKSQIERKVEITGALNTNGVEETIQFETTFFNL